MKTKSNPNSTDNHEIEHFSLPAEVWAEPSNGYASEEPRWRAVYRRTMQRIGVAYECCEIGNFVVQPDEAYTNHQRETVAECTKFAREMRQHIEQGHGLVFFGNTGTGKDHLQAAMLKIAIGYYHAGAVWTNGTDWYAAHRAAIGNKEEESFRQRYHAAPEILAISDVIPIGRELTDAQVDLLASVYDARLRHRKSTWITLNDTGTDNENGPTNFEKRVGSQLYGRIRDKSLIVRFDWPSYRRPLE